MASENIAALVVENNNNCVGGYVQWFSGIPATNGMPLSLVFPQDDEMTIVSHGQVDTRHEFDSGSDGVLRGTKLALSTWFFPAVTYTQSYEAELLVEALAPYRSARIGLVGTYQMLHATVSQIKRELPDATFVDASDLVDAIKVVKSAEEIEMIRRAATIQDAALAAAINAIEPGRTDREIAVVAQNASHELGSDQGFVLCASAPIGQPCHFGPGYLQGRTIKSGDVVSILVENSGPGGMWSEVGRTVVLGKAPQEMVEDFAFAIEAQKATLALMRPGVPASEVWEAYVELLRERGRPPEKRIHCHGQGYDLVERPLIRFDETMVIANGLNVACHPNFLGSAAFCSITDGFLITDNGVERLHKTEQRIFELE